MQGAINTTLPHTSVVSLAKDFTTNSGKRLATAFAICFMSGVFCGTVSTLMSVYLPVAVKDLQGNVSDEELTRIGATINSLFIFGWMFGGITWGFIGDKSGRARAVIYSTACFGLFTLLTSLSASWLWVSACRFMSGFGVGGCW